MDIDRDEKRVKVVLAVFCLLAAIVIGAVYFFASQRPDTVGSDRLTQEQKRQIISENSPMIKYIRLSPNADFPRKDRIRKITIHHMAGNYSLEQVGRAFSFTDRQSSANYGIDSRGEVGLYVEEKNRSWASGSEENDQQAVTVEVANEEIGGDWRVSGRAYEALIDLCADICRRNGIEKLVFTGDARGNLTFHKMFSEDTECPGPYLESKMGDIVEKVNERLSP